MAGSTLDCGASCRSPTPADRGSTGARPSAISPSSPGARRRWSTTRRSASACWRTTSSASGWSTRTTHVDLSFDGAGDIVGARTTTRARGDLVQPWQGTFSELRDFGGIRAPARGEVWWQAPEGRFVYWRGEVTSLNWSW